MVEEWEEPGDEEVEEVGEVEEEEEVEEEVTLGHQPHGLLDQIHPDPHVPIPDLPFLLSPPGPLSPDLHQVGAVVETPAATPSCVTAVRRPFSSPCVKTAPTKGVSSTSATLGTATSSCGQMNQISRRHRRVEGPPGPCLHQTPPSPRGPRWASKTRLEEAESRKGELGDMGDMWDRPCATAMRQR